MSIFVFISSGCFSRKYHKLGGLDNRCFFLKVLEDGKSKIDLLTDSVPGWNPLPGSSRADSCLLSVWSHVLSSVVARRKQALRSILIRSLILLGQGPTIMTSFNLNYFLKALSPNIVTLRVWASTFPILGRHISVHSTAVFHV